MMLFRTIKANLETILNDAAASRFQVVGHQQQGSSAEQFLGTKRRVQVFAGSGGFPKGKAGLTGPVQHEVTYRVELTVSAAATADLSVINDAGSTDPQRAAAISAFQDASTLADESFDELVEIAYQILMHGSNVDIGTTGLPIKISNRWIDSWSKGQAFPMGEYVMLTGSMDYTCQMIEEITGDIGTAIVTPAYNITTDIDGDDVEKTGVII